MLKNKFMLTQRKETMLNKIINIEAWFLGFLSNAGDYPETKLLNNILRNLNSIKSLIKKS